jgi:hypothetical protein
VELASAQLLDQVDVRFFPSSAAFYRRSAYAANYLFTSRAISVTTRICTTLVSGLAQSK